MVPRRYTQPDSEARKASEVPELTIIVCRDCHKLLDNGQPSAVSKAWNIKYRVFGYDRVHECLQATGVKIPLPEEIHE